MVIIKMTLILSARQEHMRLLLSVIIYSLLPPTTSMSTTTTRATRSITTLPPTTTISIGYQIQPVNLTFTDITSTSLNISWSHNYPVSSLSVSYYVTARTNDYYNTQWTCPLGPETMAQCYVLTPGRMYNVTVMATSGGVSRSHTETQAIDPGMPGSLTSTSHSAPNVTLSWAAAPGWVDYYSLSINGKVQKCSTNSCLVTGLQPGTQYSVTITAYSNTRPGARRQSSFQTQVVAPDPPKELRVVAMTTNTVSLHWQQPDNTGGNLTGYRLCYSFQVYLDLPSKDPICTGITILEQTNNYIVQGLTAGAFYTFQVYVTNTLYNSASENVSAQTKESVPGQVSSFTVANQGKGQVTATWQRPESPHGNITNYRLTWNKQGDTVQCSVFLISNGQPSNCPYPIGSISTIHDKTFSYVVMNLTAATMYRFTIVAFTLQGEGVLLTKELNTSVEKPGAVSNVRVIDIESNRFTVQWMIPDSNPGPTTYTATAEDATGLGWGNLTRTCNAEGYLSVTCTIQDLEEYWEYKISVTAETSEGTSDPVYADNIKRTLAGVPGAATDLNVRNLSKCDARRVNFTWMTPPVLKRNAIISQYLLKIFSTDDNAYNNVFHTDKDAQNHVYKASRLLHHEYSGLKAEHSYTWQVQSLPNGHNATGTFTTGTCTPPGWQSGYQNVTVIGSTISSVTVKLETRFFKDKSQGKITEMFLVIAPNRNISTSPGAWTDWSSAKATDFKQPYRLSLPLSIITENKGLIEIGAEKCQDKHGYQCNGRLKEAFTFYLCAYVCTSVNCTRSPVFGPFTTNTAPSGTSSPIAAIVASVLVAVLVIIVVVIILAYRSGMQLPCFHKYPKLMNHEMIVPSGRGSTHYRLVFLQDFAKYLEDMHLNGDAGLAEQYEDIQKIGTLLREQLTMDHANIEANTEKNRWMDILPYDKTRVKLQLQNDDPTSDYINASYIHGYQGADEYIATQGPLPETIHDFWRMVFENGSAFIVMLVRCQEGSRTKCEQYWPSEIGGSRNYGDILVTLDSRINLETHNKATLTVSWHGKFLTVTHFHYLDFPDFSADVNIVHFIEFVKEVRESIPKDMEEPVVVHCSGGVGQTGTYIVLDYLYQLLQDSDLCSMKCVDLYGLVVKLREHRMEMVQTESQYIMIHECFLLMLENRKREIGMPSDLHSITGSLRRTNSGYNTNVEREYVNMKMIRKPSNKKREDNIYMNVASLSKLACNPNASNELTMMTSFNTSVI